jgi:autotransporter-associated beta strand protein
MSRARQVSTWAAAAAALSIASSTTYGQELTEFQWDASKTGAQTWQQSGNWTTANFPNGPLHTATLSRPLAANLNVNTGAGVSVAGLTIGGSSAAVTSQISGGTLTFRNDFVPPALVGNADFDGDTFVDGRDFLIWQRNLGVSGQTNNNRGDADANTVVEAADLTIWKNQYGRGSELFTIGAAFVETKGVAGSINVIDAPVHLNNDQLEIAGTRNLTINGNVSFAGDPANGGVSASALRVIDPSLTVTLNGNLAMTNADSLEGVDLRINENDRSQGTLIINGILSGSGDLVVGGQGNGARLPLSSVRLNGNNTYTGSFRAGRGNLILGHDNALGRGPGVLPGDPTDDVFATYRQAGPANQFGYNIISTDDARTISNNMVVAQWQTIKGEHSLTWAGTISQTNNRGIINMLPAGKTFTVSGRLNIWENDEPDIERRFTFDGTGKSIITGNIHPDPQESNQNRGLRKTGSGVLVINVAAGNNSHAGPEVIDMGNLHYATNDSLNVGSGLIVARGGAVGVDTGVSNNAAFMAKIDPTSRGGLMLAPSDAAATLDFTGVLSNASNMTVAAPETGMTFTGSITPANAKYQLGGGTGTLTLPNVQLTGANSLEVRNGGTVQLLGDNTFTGSTTILTKYTSTNEAMAAVDSNLSNLSSGSTYFKQVAPTLVVDKLSNGGAPSSIGSASSDAANLFIHGSTLKYVGPGDATNRLFTIGTGGATIDASGTGAVVFSNTGALGRDEAEDRPGTLDDFTGTRDSNSIYDVADTSDIVIGMTVTDPDPGGIPPSSGATIPAGTIVTGISDDGRTIGLNGSYGFRLKQDTRIEFGTTPRTLTLAGTNMANNTLASAISNSTKGGVVNLEKTGGGVWVVSGANSYTGTTTVADGTLLVNGVHAGGGAYTVAAGATLGGTGTTSGNLTVNGVVNPGTTGAGTLTVSGNGAFNAGSTALFQLGGTAVGQFDKLAFSGTLAAGGVLDVDLINGFTPSAGNAFDILDFTSATGSFTLNLPALGGGLSWNTSQLLTTGTISVAAALAAVPEPGAAALALAAGGALAMCGRRRR